MTSSEHDGQRGSRTDTAAGTTAAPGVPRTARGLRHDAEAGMGARFAKLVHVHAESVQACADSMGIARPKLYPYFDGRRQPTLVMMELAPPAVERAYLAERAAFHGYDLSPIADGSTPHGAMHLMAEIADVMRATTASESDGHLSPAEAEEELREIEQVEAALSARKALCRRAIAERGVNLRAVGGAK